jgi:uncharacterized protein (DUF2141 family)
MKKILLIVLLITIQFVSAQKKQSGSSIVVQLNGIKEPTGQVLLSLFKSDEGFPTQPEKAFMWKRANVTASSLIISLDGLPLGTYAIAVVHDENSNDVMDRDWLGLPNEDYGISNNVSGTVIPPSFDEAKFTVTGKRDTIKIEMHP